MHNEVGFKNRLNWLTKYLLRENTFSYFSVEEYESTFRSSVQEISKIDNQALIIIWTGENAHDQTGLRYVCQLLQEKKNNVAVVNASAGYQKHFNPNGPFRYYPFHLGEINPDQVKILLSDHRLFEPISDNDRSRLQQEWLDLSQSEKLLRIWKKGQILSVGEDYFDILFIRYARRIHRRERKIYIKAIRLIGEVLGHAKQVIGEEFLEYRLLQMIQQGIFLCEGSLENARSYRVKLNV